MCGFNHNLFEANRRRRGFTLVEVMAGAAVLAIMLGSVLVVMNQYVDAVIEMGLREQAFEVARGNMEQLLSEAKLSDLSEFGDSEQYPEIEWEMLVEPFYEPVTNTMWIRAVCSAGFTDRDGEFENIELEHWITNLTAAQVKQVLAQQQIEAEYMDLLAGGEESEIEETTTAYLEQEGLDHEAYKRFTKQQKRKKLEYITEKGFEGYEKYIEQLQKEENEFLEKLGMDFDGYNEFAAGYVPKSLFSGTLDSGGGGADAGGPGSGRADNNTGDNTGDDSGYDFDIDWDRIPPELIALIEQLLGIKRPENE